MPVKIRAVVAACALTASSAVSATQGQGSRPGKLLDPLLACEGIAEQIARLNCYDVEVRKLKESKKAVSLPASRNEKPVQQVDATINAVAPYGYGNWILILSDKSVWQTTEPPRGLPAKGDKIHISKGILSGYRAAIEGRSPIGIRKLQ